MPNMPLDEFLATVKDGDEHGWDEEIDWLWENHEARLNDLIESVRQSGIREPIQIGPDWRCWDGHHRVAVAVFLGFDEIPVEHV